MSIAREGIPFIAGGLLAALLGLLVLALLPEGGGWAGILMGGVAGAGALFAAFSLWFFRDPHRVPPSAPEIVVSPADGKVVSVTEVDDEPFMEGPARRISIFLNVFNVHVQRVPRGGAVTHYEYHPGDYLMAWEEKASLRNERASLGLATDRGPVLVRQIAGFVARRIVTDPRPGDGVKRGDRLGLIRFGSRVDLFLPADWTVEVAPGDRVQGGSTPVGRVP